MDKISASRLGSMAFCPRQHYYRYTLELEPKKSSDALDVGTLVHKGIELFYRDGTIFRAEEELGDVARKVNSALLAYRLLAQTHDRFEVVALEKEFEVPMSELGVNLHGIIDGIVRLDGQLWIMEHKTCYQHWSDERIGMAQQHVLYEMAATELYEEPIAGTFYNFLRITTRGGDYATDARRVTVPADQQAMLSVWDDVADRVDAMNAGHKARNTGQHCKWCDMFTLCRTDYLGGDRDEVIRSFYKPRGQDADVDE